VALPILHRFVRNKTLGLNISVCKIGVIDVETSVKHGDADAAPGKSRAIDTDRGQPPGKLIGIGKRSPRNPRLKPGIKGPPGERGQRGEKGDPGAAAPTILAWKIDRVNYLVTPIMSDGSEVLPIEMRGLFEQFHDERG
jgi:hypothetical protein